MFGFFITICALILIIAIKSRVLFLVKSLWALFKFNKY